MSLRIVSVLCVQALFVACHRSASHTGSNDDREGAILSEITRPLECAPRCQPYPTLPTIPAIMRERILMEIHDSQAIREAAQQVGGSSSSQSEWQSGIATLEKLHAVWCLQACLCHQHPDVHVYALRALSRLRDPAAVPFLIIYAHYMAAPQDGSEEATVHGVVQHEIAASMSAITGIAANLEKTSSGYPVQDTVGLQKAIRDWMQWSAAHATPDI